MRGHTAHLADDGDRRQTVCGEPWQGWQMPNRPGVREIAGPPLPPHDEPRAHVDTIRQCQACLRRGAELLARGS